MSSGLLTSHLQTANPSHSIGHILSTMVLACAMTWFSGCSQQRKQTVQFSPDCGPCQTMAQQIDYPDLVEEQDTDGGDLLTGPPITLANFKESTPWELTVEECVELALANGEVMQNLGGTIVSFFSPAGVATLYDQAINETGQGSVEAALSAFDAQVNASFIYNRNERKFNNPIFGGGVDAQIANTSNFRFELSKQTATGATFSLRNLTDYNRTNTPIATPTSPFGNRFGSVYDMVQQMEVRQPLGRGSGTLINRIAGPNATPGNYNGVLIARIRSDISLADFESSVRNLVRDVEYAYWELYFGYRDLDTKITARDAARKVWENRKLRWENGIGRPDDEAQARQQYFSFQFQAQNALAGTVNGPTGVLGSERNLRRLLGLPINDGSIIRPISAPSLAPVVFDWDQSQTLALERRVEIRRQKWTVRQRELELIASKALNKWQFDFVGQYGFRGFGDDLFGNRSISEGSAFDDLINGDLDDWQVGLELGGAIGNRYGYLAIRNAELRLVRERALLKEQQRQVLHDLSAAFTEADRAMESLKSSFNSRVAAQQELDPKAKRVKEGQDQVFFLLDAEQRVASSESAVHRSVADYNQALLDFAFASGTLLSRYNIRLTEGEWSDEAKCDAIRKAPRFEKRGPNQCDVDTFPVSSGPLNQVVPRQGQPAGQFNSLSEDPAMDKIPPDTEQPNDQPNENEPTIEGELQPEIEAPKTDAAPEYDTLSSSGFDFSVPSVTAKKYLQRRFERR